MTLEEKQKRLYALTSLLWKAIKPYADTPKSDDAWNDVIDGLGGYLDGCKELTENEKELLTRWVLDFTVYLGKEAGNE